MPNCNEDISYSPLKMLLSTSTPPGVVSFLWAAKPRPSTQCTMSVYMCVSPYYCNVRLFTFSLDKHDIPGLTSRGVWLEHWLKQSSGPLHLIRSHFNNVLLRHQKLGICKEAIH